MMLKPYQERAQNCCANKHARDANEEREDERFSKDAVLEYYRSNFNMEFDVEVSPKILFPDGTKRNPDYFLYPKGQGLIDKQKILLEVRQSGTGFIVDDNEQCDMVYGKNVKERCEWEAVIFNWLIRLQKLIEEWALSDQTILLEIDIATTKINNKLLYALNEKLKEIFFDNAEVGMQQEIQIENEIFYAGSTICYAGMIEYSPLKAIYGLNLYSSCLAIENDWWLQIYHIIKNCVEDKEEQYKKVQDCKKWLVIFNKHPLLTENDYREVFLDMNIEGFSDTHTFDKIFIVHDKQAYLLYERM